MNRIIISGFLGNDPDIRYAQNTGTAIARFDVAVRRRFAKEGETDTDWFPCVCFAGKAEFCEKYLRKGSKVIIEGEMHNDDYEKDGVKHYTNKVIIDNIEFGDSKKGSDTGQQEEPKQETKKETKAKQKEPEPEINEDFMNIPDGIDDELPFS